MTEQIKRKFTTPQITTRRQFLLITIFCVILYIGWNISLSQFVIMPNLLKLEEAYAKKDIDSCIDAINREIYHLGKLLMDWAVWDDAYNFAEDRNPQFIESNMDPYNLKSIGIHLLYMCDTNGTIILSQLHGPDREPNITLREFPTTFLGESHILLQHTSLNSHIDGLYMTEYGPMLVSSHSILQSGGNGPSRGFFIMGRFLNDETIADLRAQVKVKFNIRNIQNKDISKKEAAIVQKLATNDYLTEIVSPQILHIYKIMPDMKGNPALLIRAEIPRDIINKSKQAMNTPMISAFFAVIGILFIFAILFIDARNRTSEIEELVTERTAELQKAKEQAEMAVKVKGQFLANMSHEIRTPLNAVLGFSDIMTKTTLSDKQREYLETIHSSGEMLLSIINQVLDMAKMQEKVTIDSTDFNIQDLIFDVFKTCISRMKHKPFDTYIDISPDVPLNLKGDSLKLKQVFHNLVGNAMKFTDHGSIGVIVRRDATAPQDDPTTVPLRISIKDTGIGIPPEKAHVIFTPFTQVDGSTTRKYGGIGLGLTICQTIITAMGGKIWVESQLGRGSEFITTMRLTIGEPIKPIDTTRIKGKRVLIVDDNAVACAIHTHYCAAIGLTVLSTEDSGYSALNRLATLKEMNELPDVILCDLVMEGIDGYELAEKIRADAAFATIKLVAVTFDTKIEDTQRDKKLFDGYILKPVIINHLAETIARIFINTATDAEPVDLCAGTRILVVEDSVPNQMLLAAYFDQLKCRGTFANNGNEAIENLKKSTYDLCFMDLQMPEMGGVEATQIIRKTITKDLPIIALTAAGLIEDKQAAEDAGMNDFLTKPVTIGALREKILRYRKA